MRLIRTTAKAVLALQRGSLARLLNRAPHYKQGVDKAPRRAYTSTMMIGASQITLHLPDCHSLKEKRQVIKSVVARVRNQFEVAIAEVEEQDRWQIAVLGVTCVSNSRQHCDEVLGNVRRYIEETRPDIVISNVETEIITW